MEVCAYREQNAPARTYSFSSLMKARFSKQLYGELYEYADKHGIQMVYASIRSIYASATKRDILYANVLYDCKVKGEDVGYQRLRLDCGI